jgi:predicted nucleic acid-binding protein
LISSKVVQEFLYVATRKFKVPLDPEDCRVYLLKVLNPICQVYPDLDLYQSALNILRETGYSFYDSLILAGALRGGCSVLYSEDLQAGQIVGGVKIVNPFDLGNPPGSTD